MSRRPPLAAIALALFATAALAAPAGKPKTITVPLRPAPPVETLRGADAPPSGLASAAPSAPTGRSPDTSFMSPGLIAPVAPRIGGLSDPEEGGAACRTSCAQDHYFCLTQDDEERCAPAWGQCVAACPANSADAL